MSDKVVLYERDGRIGRITLNRPEVMNAINKEMPEALKDAVVQANADQAVHVIVLSGAGRAFCAGYDLTLYIHADGDNGIIQKMPWDPMKDYAFMMKNTECFMSLWRSHKPVICKVHGDAVGGGSDIALCSDLVIMAHDALIGYMPSGECRVIPSSRVAIIWVLCRPIFSRAWLIISFCIISWFWGTPAIRSASASISWSNSSAGTDLWTRPIC